MRFIMEGLRRLMGGYARVSSVADEGNGSGKAVALTSQQAAPSSSQQQQQRSVAMVRAATGHRCVHAWAAGRCCMQPRKLVLSLTLAMRLPHALRVQVSVKGMTCAACSGAVERALRCAREGQHSDMRLDSSALSSCCQPASLFVACNGSTQLHGVCRALPGVHKASVALLQEAAEVSLQG